MKQKRTWPGGILRGQSGACPHKIARVYTKAMPKLQQASNPEFPRLTHAVTMAVTYQQLQIMVEAPYTCMAPIEPQAAAVPRHLSHFYNGSFIESVQWMWHACRTGIAVCIRSSKVALFVPFCNPMYRNTWSMQARSAVPPVGLQSDRWWSNGWTLCGDEIPEQMWSDHGVCAILNMLMVCCERRAMGDCDFIINKRDSACVRLDGCDAMNPFDLYQAPIPRPPLVPVLSLYTGDQFADVAMPLPSDWHRLSCGTFEGQRPQQPAVPPRDVPWNIKQDCAIFRGSLTGAGGHRETHQRLALLHMHDGVHVDAKATSANQRLRFCPLDRNVVTPDPTGLDIGRHNYIPMHQQQERYRYSITADGHSGADRLAALMGGEQVVLKVDPPAHALCPDTWASLQLFAWEHYIPVSKSLDNLHERLRFARQQDTQIMRQNCKSWARNEKELTMDWWQCCTCAMSRLRNARQA